ncbi:MAG: arylesterase [Bdellovibrionales bacterium]|nr:arylesterase [Bdellovibrionales bacterium]
MKFLIFLTVFWPSIVSAKTVVFLGDSLTEGYGIAKKDSYPELIGKKLKSNGFPSVKIVNGSISGSTSASAKSRLKWYLKTNPDLLVLALGANDGLRGIDPNVTERNLDEVVTLAKKHKIKVILCGLRMPPNYGNKFRKQFVKMYQSVADRHKIVFVPQLLDKVAGEPTLNQEDGIHPNEKGHQSMADHLYPYVKGQL